MALDPTQTDMAADPNAAPAEAESAGYEIIIKVAADGTLSVGVEQESAAEEAQEVQGGMTAGGEVENESAFKPVASIKEALTYALDIFRADGDTSGLGQEDADFNSGYKPQMGM